MSFERRSLGHRGFALVSTDLERNGFLAAFTERTGGASPSPYDSLNLSLVTEDDPENGRRNRRRVIEGLGIPPFATPYQVHGARTVRVGAKRAGAGFDDPETRVADADALFTSSAKLPIAVLTADCLPIVLASPARGTVAVVHAGWRGLAAGMLEAAVGLFDQPAEVRVAIGPAIGPCHYEVGEDVALAVASAIDTGAVTEQRGGSLYLDLLGTVRKALRGAGIRRVAAAELCTACERRRFFSYRRDGDTGRQCGLAMRM